MSMILNFEVGCGTDIEEAVREGCCLSDKLGAIVTFDFNGVTMVVSHDGNNGEVLDTRVKKYVDIYMEVTKK